MVFLALVALLAAEVAAVIAVAERIGAFDAIGLLILVSLCGPWVLRRAGLGAWRRAVQRAAAGGAPDGEVLDGLLVFAAGLLICIPGFVTDAAGVVLLLSPVRALVRRRLSRRAANSLLLRFGGSAGPAATGRSGRAGRWMNGRANSGEVVDASSHRPPPEQPKQPQQPPDPPRPSVGPPADRRGPPDPGRV